MATSGRDENCMSMNVLYAAYIDGWMKGNFSLFYLCEHTIWILNYINVLLYNLIIFDMYKYILNMIPIKK